MRFLGGAREPHGGSHGGARLSRGGARHSHSGSRGGARQSFDGARRDFRASVTHHRADNASHPQADTSLKNKNSPVKDDITFADVARISPPPESSNPPPSSSLKRCRSPENEEVCKHCLRYGHKIEDFRHQLTCRRCSGIGHFATRCPLKHSQSTTPREHLSLKKPSPPTKPLLHIPAR